MGYTHCHTIPGFPDRLLSDVGLEAGQAVGGQVGSEYHESFVDSFGCGRLWRDLARCHVCLVVDRLLLPCLHRCPWLDASALEGKAVPWKDRFFRVAFVVSLVWTHLRGVDYDRHFQDNERRINTGDIHNRFYSDKERRLEICDFPSRPSDTRYV